MSNGPIMTVTGPATLKYRLTEDMQVIEFMLPMPVHIVDTAHWKGLECEIKGIPILINKPLPFMKSSEPDFRLGNEGADAHCTVLQVATPSGQNYTYPTPHDIWPLIQKLFAWMRVKARHYWLLHGHSGFGSVYRGSVIQQKGLQTGLRNFSTYGQCCVVRPLTEDIWLSLQNEVSAQCFELPIDESLFCDALISAVAGETLKAVLELGVAAEIAITQLLVDAASLPPNTPEKRKFLAKNGDWDRFHTKLKEWPGKLRLQSASSFQLPLGPKDWVDGLLELYQCRNGVAHGGTARLAKHVAWYMFATNVLLAYCREQRKKIGVPVYSYPAGRNPHEQIISFHDAIISSETNMVFGTFSD